MAGSDPLTAAQLPSSSPNKRRRQSPARAGAATVSSASCTRASLPLSLSFASLIRQINNLCRSPPRFCQTSFLKQQGRQPGARLLSTPKQVNTSGNFPTDAATARLRRAHSIVTTRDLGGQNN